MTRFMLDNLFRIVAAFGIMLLVIAANIEPPPAWLLVPGWLILGAIAFGYFEDIPKKSHYKGGIYLMAIPFLFLYAGIEGPGLWHSLFALLSAPSVKHLTGLITGKPFLVLVVLYLACVCVSFELQARGKSIGEEDEDDPRWRQGKIAFELGQKAFLENNMKEALEHFDRAIQCGFSGEGIYGDRGLCLQHLDFYLDSIDDFTQAILLAPASSSLYYMRSESRKETGDIYGCIADLKEAVRLSKGGDKLNEGFEIMAKELGWDGAVSYYESRLTLATTYLDEPAERLGLRLRGNLKRRMALDLPALPEPLG